MSIVNRAKNLIINPKDEWQIIARESATVGGLFTGYAMILALIPVIALIVGHGILGLGSNSFGAYIPGSGLSSIAILAVFSYFIGLALLWLIAMIVNAVVPSFNGKQDIIQSMKLMVYAATPTWLAGLFAPIPMIGGLVSLAGTIYAVYLIYLGVGPVLNIPDEKVTGMTVVTVLIYLVVSLIVGGIIATMLFGVIFGGGMMAAAMAGV